MKLTKAAIARLKLPQGKTDAIYFDDELRGFGLRLRAGGKRVWVVQYRIGLKQRRATLGDVHKLDADAARKQAKDRLAKVTLGGDPQRDKAEARAKATETLETAIENYLAYKKPTLRERSYKGVERYLTQTYWKTLHELPIHEIKRGDVAAQLTQISTKHGTTVAVQARVALSGLFAWAMGEGFAIEANPVIGTNKPPEPESRDRVLSDGELAEVWKACADDDYGRIVKLLVLTGARREEIGGLRWQEINIERAVLNLPADRTKNGLPHTIPLSPLALSIVGAVARRDGRDHVFGDGPRRGGDVARGFQGWARAKTAVDRRILDARLKGAAKSKGAVQPMAPWRVHDLRRSCATGMADLGVLPHVIEATLNHITGHKAGVAGIYNHARYDGEMRAALVLWADHVNSLVQGIARKVVPLRGRA
jgi:integrase